MIRKNGYTSEAIILVIKVVSYNGIYKEKESLHTDKFLTL